MFLIACGESKMNWFLRKRTPLTDSKERVKCLPLMQHPVNYTTKTASSGSLFPSIQFRSVTNIFWTNLRPQKYTQVVLKCYDKCFQKQHRHNLRNGNTIQTSWCNCQMRYFLYKFRSTDSAITNFEKGLGRVKIRRRFKINQVQCDFRFKSIQ